MNFNAAQGYAIAKEIQQIRAERRGVKNQIATFCSFRDTFYKSHRGIGIKLYQTAKKMKVSGWEPPKEIK